MIKRIVTLMLCGIFLLSMSACGQEIGTEDAEQSKPSEMAVMDTEDDNKESFDRVQETENESEVETVDMQVGIFNFETKKVLLNNSYEMPIMGLGTYALDYDTCVNSVMALLKNGGRLIDTAYFYGNEDAVGEGVRRAMEEYDIPREEIFVTTKLYPNQFTDPEGAIRQSFDKLDIEYIDLFMLHHPGTGMWKHTRQSSVQ